MFTGGAEQRSLENPTVSLASAEGWDVFGFTNQTITGESVTFEKALTVPAIWAAVNTIAGTIAHLPLHLFKTDAAGAVSRAYQDPLYKIVHDRPNNVHTSYVFRKWLVSQLFAEGRALVLIATDKAGRTASLIPLAKDSVTIKQAIQDGQLQRTYRVGSITYDQSQILDFVLMPKADGLGCYSPIIQNRDAIALMIAAQKYSATLLSNGGVPPMILEGPPLSPQAQERATEQLESAISIGRDRKRKIVPVPNGHKLSKIGLNPAEQQLLELRQFQIGEASRIFNIAPAMLHDLTTGTYSNVEQQNLNFAQHTIVPLLELIEQEMNAKLFGKRNTSSYVEFDIDGLQRGDFLSRMNGLAKAVQTGLVTPNEARALDNRPPMDGGDDLMIQGATVRIKDQPNLGEKKKK